MMLRKAADRLLAILILVVAAVPLVALVGSLSVPSPEADDDPTPVLYYRAGAADPEREADPKDGLTDDQREELRHRFDR